MHCVWRYLRCVGNCTYLHAGPHKRTLLPGMRLTNTFPFLAIFGLHAHNCNRGYLFAYLNELYLFNLVHCSLHSYRIAIFGLHAHNCNRGYLFAYLNELYLFNLVHYSLHSYRIETVVG